MTQIAVIRRIRSWNLDILHVIFFVKKSLSPRWLRYLDQILRWCKMPLWKVRDRKKNSKLLMKNSTVYNAFEDQNSKFGTEKRQLSQKMMLLVQLIVAMMLDRDTWAWSEIFLACTCKRCRMQQWFQTFRSCWMLFWPDVATRCSLCRMSFTQSKLAYGSS